MNADRRNESAANRAANPGQRVKVLGRFMSADRTVREREVEAGSHGAAKIQLKSEIGEDERLLFIRVVQE